MNILEDWEYDGIHPEYIRCGKYSEQFKEINSESLIYRNTGDPPPPTTTKVKKFHWKVFIRGPRMDPEAMWEAFANRKSQEWSERCTSISAQSMSASNLAEKNGDDSSPKHKIE